MNRLIATVAAVFAAGLTVTPASFAQSSQPNGPGKPAAGSAAGETLNQEDKTFVKHAALGGLAEVELSKMAQKSLNADVKNFADRMILDHTAANEQLSSLATGLGVEMPKTIDSEHQRMREKLATLHGKAFDAQYMRDMAEDHNKAVKLFQQVERTGHNPALKEFAQKTLPTLEEHQKMALDISRRLSRTAAK
jgi:putative membrane protein